MHERSPGLPRAGERHRSEMTARGLLIGALITVVFMSANIYMGLKTGMTFSSSIPAAIISMAVLHLLGSRNILENNMVQTQASAAGTLCNVILVLPGLVMIGRWHGFPFWQTMSISLLGGCLGVMFSIPLRRALVMESDLPFPEGVAAAEVLHAGSGDTPKEGGLRSLAIGSGAAGMLMLLGSTGVKLLGDSLSWSFMAAGAVFRFGTGFSLALVGVGYLVGIGACAALLVGIALAWGVAVPLLTAAAGVPPEQAAATATRLWQDQVRLIGAGIIAAGGVWTLIILIRPMRDTIRGALAAARARHDHRSLPRQERDIPIGWVALAVVLLAVPLTVLLASFARPTLSLPLIVAASLGTILFGLLMATACGYLAGLLGSSSSPISGIGILTTMAISLLLDALPLGTANGQILVAITLFITAIIITASSIANDNLQDLKTGQLVDATPWRQQAVLLVGVAAGAMVTAPLLETLYDAYGFVGHMPHGGMNEAMAMAAPQASLMSAISSGIFSHRLPWRMVLIGIAIGTALIGVEAWARRRGHQFPVLTVGIGMYLPPTVVATIAIGGVLGWLAERQIKRREPAASDGVETAQSRLRRRGVLLSSGFLVGESLAGMILAALEAAGAHLPAFTLGAATWLGLGIFIAALLLFYRSVTLRATSAAPLSRAAGAG